MTRMQFYTTSISDRKRSTQKKSKTRTIYYALLKNQLDKSQLQTIARQIRAKNVKFLADIFEILEAVTDDQLFQQSSNNTPSTKNQKTLSLS